MRELQNRMRRLCGLIMAAVLLLTGVGPVLAQEDTAPSYSVFDLKVGQILQPNDIITYPIWHTDQTIVYHNYAENNPSYEFDHERVLAISSGAEFYKVKSYENGGEDGLWREPSLPAEDFAGWKVMNRSIETVSSGTCGVLMLMAVPKNVKNSFVCSTDVAADEKNGESTKTLSIPDGAGVELYGFDKNTGEPLKKENDGTLIASPGDVVYAYTTPAAAFYSEIMITAGGKELGPYNTYEILSWYDQSVNQDGSRISKTTGPKEVSTPALADAFSAFIMPHENVTITALYHKSNLTYSVQYHTGNAATPDIKLDAVPLNTVLTAWDPEKEPNAGCSAKEGRSILYWDKKTNYFYDRWDDTDEYYERGESFPVLKNTKLTAQKYEVGYQVEIDPDAPVTAYYYNARKNGPRVQAHWAYQNKMTAFVFAPDAVKNGKSLKALQVNDGTVCELNGYSYVDAYNVKENADLRITAEYYDAAPKDLFLDLAKGEASFSSRDSDLGAEKADGYRFLASFLNPCKNSTIDGINVLTPGDFFNNASETSGFVDLNHDGTWDLRTRKAYGDKTDYMLFERLPGAKYCAQTSVTLPCNQSGYGSFTIKLYDTCKVEYINEGKSVFVQDWKIGASLDAPSAKAAVAKEGYTLKGWSKTPDGKELFDFSQPVSGDLKLYAVWEKNAVKDPEKSVAAGDVIKDPVSGQTYVVTKTGQDGEVKLQEATVKKGTVKVPDAINIGGQSYKVTAIDKKAFKKASAIKTLDLGCNIAKILKGAFKNCKKLKVVRIRNKKKVIAFGKNTFGKWKGKIILKVPKNMVKKYKQYIKKKKLTGKYKVKKG